MQPVQKTERRTIGQWIFHDLSLKTVVVTAVGLSAAFYGTKGQLSVGEERDKGIEARITEQGVKLGGRIDDADDRLKLQLEAIRDLRATTLRTATYDRDQIRLDSALRDLSERQRTTDEVLMQRGLLHTK